MAVSGKQLAEYWPKIDALIARAKEDPGLRDRLQYGTPDQKLEVLQEAGLEFEDLVYMYNELRVLLSTRAKGFWWW